MLDSFLKSQTSGRRAEKKITLLRNSKNVQKRKTEKLRRKQSVGCPRFRLQEDRHCRRLTLAAYMEKVRERQRGRDRRWKLHASVSSGDRSHWKIISQPFRRSRNGK
ncbi:UNVERIFIED_CONTAM: hypothetical protein PYX00_003731 [Menopon gallinae]|uniref:Uncharacterized protein n=1 Tax=Menopon gallinae TaxID=328185 RepID=A0AAW2I1S2_9NEOP